MSTNPIVTLISKNGMEVQATLQAVKQSVTFRTMLELLEEEKTSGVPIPAPEVDGETLGKLMQWCEYHRDDVSAPDEPDVAIDRTKAAEIPQWDQTFLQVERVLLFKLILAANYLEIPRLLDYGIIMVARGLEGLSAAEMREYLNVPNDFTPEEELAKRENNKWGYSG
ncbi:hypothetical protein ANO14919_003220 [Xylariales sp. No.14919]|nr:hypothetical protein ANO14919_003220 [Xylariales sp. No.14919]